VLAFCHPTHSSVFVSGCDIGLSVNFTVLSGSLLNAMIILINGNIFVIVIDVTLSYMLFSSYNDSVCKCWENMSDFYRTKIFELLSCCSYVCDSCLSYC